MNSYKKHDFGSTDNPQKTVNPSCHSPRHATRLQRRFLTPAGNPSDPEGLFAYMQRYLEYLEIKGHTAMGIYNAERYVRAFIRWGEPCALKHPSQISDMDIERYQLHLSHRRKSNGEPLSVFSQRSALIPLRGYFRWLVKHGHLVHDPTSSMELPRPKQMLPRYVLTAHEAEKVLRQPDVENPLGLRDRAMLEILYSAGLRRMELANLHLPDVDRQRELVFVNQGKWQKDRWVPISERALKWLQRYVNEVRPFIAASPDDGTLFLTRNGLPFNASWLSTTISRHVRGANLGKHGSCHLFRHTLATLMLENGADIRFIQAMLGHMDLKSTQIYTHVAIKQLKSVHQKTHPGCNCPSGGARLSRRRASRRNFMRSPYALIDSLQDDETIDEAARYLILRRQLAECSHFRCLSHPAWGTPEFP